MSAEGRQLFEMSDEEVRERLRLLNAHPISDDELTKMREQWRKDEELFQRIKRGEEPLPFPVFVDYPPFEPNNSPDLRDAYERMRSFTKAALRDSGHTKVRSNADRSKRKAQKLARKVSRS